MSHFSGRDVLVQPQSTQKEHPKPRPVAGGKGETLPYNPLLRYGHRFPPRQTRTHQQLPSLVANVGLPPRCTPRAQHATSSPERASSSGKTSETAPRPAQSSPQAHTGQAPHQVMVRVETPVPVLGGRAHRARPHIVTERESGLCAGATAAPFPGSPSPPGPELPHGVAGCDGAVCTRPPWRAP